MLGTKFKLKINRGADNSDKGDATESGGDKSARNQFSIPDRYQHLILTPQEMRLLQKFAKTKKILLKVQPRPQQNNKAEEEANRRKNNIPKNDEDRRKRARVDAFASHHQYEEPSFRYNAGRINRASPDQDNNDFPEEGMLLKSEWCSTESKSGPLILELPNLQFEQGANDSLHGNTVLIWGVWPEASSRFSINICPTASFKENDPRTTVLYHFNPRSPPGRKPSIVQNYFVPGQKWCKREDISIVGMPIVKSRRFELRITISPDMKFIICIDGRHVSTFNNQCEISHLQPGSNLYLIVPVLEEHYGDAENVVIHGVWWGYHTWEPPARGSIPGALPTSNYGNNSRPFPGGPRERTPKRDFGHGGHGGGGWSGGTPGVALHVSGFPGLSHDDIHQEIVRLMTPYGIEKDEHTGQPRIKVFEDKGFGFVTLLNDSVAKEAIASLNGTIGRAGVRLGVSRARNQSRR